MIKVASGNSPSHNGPSMYKNRAEYKIASPKSLNLAMRKRGYDRIHKENRALAERLFSQKSQTTKKSFDDEFKQMEIIRQRI